MAVANLMTGTLEVVGQLILEMGDDSARIEARGSRILLALPSLPAGRTLFQNWSIVKSRRESIRRAHEMLSQAGLTLQVDIGTITIGLLGAESRPGLTSRLLGVYPFELRVIALISWLRHRSAT